MAGTIIRSYRELIRLKTFEERFRYLKLKGAIGARTFGGERIYNQVLYHSPEWRSFKQKIIIRDNGCDLGIEGYDVRGDRIIVHHINPLQPEDIIYLTPAVFDEDNVISTSLQTHNAIHYGDENLLPKQYVERRPGDTCPWKT